MLTTGSAAGVGTGKPEMSVSPLDLLVNRNCSKQSSLETFRGGKHTTRRKCVKAQWLFPNAQAGLTEASATFAGVVPCRTHTALPQVLAHARKTGLGMRRHRNAESYSLRPFVSLSSSLFPWCVTESGRGVGPPVWGSSKGRFMPSAQGCGSEYRSAGGRRADVFGHCYYCVIFLAFLPDGSAIIKPFLMETFVRSACRNCTRACMWTT